MSRQIKCVDCPYYSADEFDKNIADLPYCHYQYNDGHALAKLKIERKRHL